MNQGSYQDLAARINRIEDWLLRHGFALNAEKRWFKADDCTWPQEDYELHLQHPQLWKPKPEMAKRREA